MRGQTPFDTVLPAVEKLTGNRERDYNYLHDGFVRQLANSSGEITYARAYDPYGVVTQTPGSLQTSYAFTGEAYGVGIATQTGLFQSTLPMKR